MNPFLPNSMKRFFSHYLPVQKGLAANTILAYRDALRLLLCYAADSRKKSVDELSVEDLDEPLVLAFLDHLETARGCSVRTRNARLAAIRAFFAFVAREEPALLPHCQRIRGIPLKRAEQKMLGYLEDQEVQAVLDAVDAAARNGLRDKTLLLLLYNSGARVSEIVNLKLTDLRLDDSPQVKLLGKGGKHRSCPIWRETAEALRAYLAQRVPRQPGQGQVFLNTTGLPLTRFGARYILRKYVAKGQNACPSLAGKRVSPHTIRHTTAMHLLRSGNEVNMVGYWLGHADLNTTHVYVEIDMEMKRQMLDKAPAPAVDTTVPWKKPGLLDWLSRLAKAPELCGAPQARRPHDQALTAEKQAEIHIMPGLT